VEPSFQEMVRTTVSEPDFQKQAGGLFDLASDLAGEPLSLPTGPSKKKASDVKDATPTTASPPRSSAGRQLRLFVGLAVGVMLIAALASGAILFGMGPSREGLGEGQGPVKVIVEDRARGAGARDANSGTKKAAGDAAPGQGDGSAAESLMATKADGSPASTAPPRPTVQPLDGRRVTATLLKRRRAILRCFERAGTSKVKNVVIRLEVARNGAVSWAKVEPASEQGTPMGKCLAAVATKTKFPAHRAEALVFRVPLAVTVQ